MAVSIYAFDDDGSVTRVDLDLDGDGTYEIQEANPGGGEAIFDKTVTYPTAGQRTVRMRVVDDGGATTVATGTIDAHSANIPPVAALSSSVDIGRPGVELTLTGSGTDVDGTIANYAFDLDGNGSYETDNGPAQSVKTSFATGGTKLVGVRVTDSGGATATSRRTIEVKEGNDAPRVDIFRTRQLPQLLRVRLRS